MGSLSGSIVFATYTPKLGREDDLVDLISAHLPLLQRLGLATDRPALILRSRSNGTLVELARPFPHFDVVELPG